MSIIGGVYKGKYGFDEVYPNFEKSLGKRRANALVNAIKELGYFVVESDDLSKGKFVLVVGTSKRCKDYFKTVTELKDKTIKLIKQSIADKHITSYKGYQLINDLQINPTPKIEQYKYTGTAKDNSLVKEEIIYCFGKEVGDMLMWALDVMGYFIIPSDDLNKGNYILVDGLCVGYESDSFYRNIKDFKNVTINMVKNYIAQGYMDKGTGKDILEVLEKK